MSQLIYIETSIPSFYHETRAGQLQTMREWTREWWKIARRRDELVTSLPVIAELEDAPEPKREFILFTAARLRADGAQMPTPRVCPAEELASLLAGDEADMERFRRTR